MSDIDINKSYVSPYDKFLAEFDLRHEKTASQLKEIEKHAKIAKARDNARQSDDDNKMWEGF